MDEMAKYFQSAKDAADAGLFGDNWRNVSDASRERIYNTAMTMYQNDLNQEWYDKYGSPAAQMAEYAKAGLNPNLVYQQGSNSAQTAPRKDSPSLVSGDRSEKFSRLLQGVEIASQIAQSVGNIIGNVYSARQQIQDSNLNTLKYNYLMKAYGKGITFEGSDDLKKKFDAYLMFGQPYNNYLKNENTFLDDVVRRSLWGNQANYYGAKSYYQTYYNKNLLPIDLTNKQYMNDYHYYQAELQKYFYNLQKTLPAESRAWLSLIMQMTGSAGGLLKTLMPLF